MGERGSRVRTLSGTSWDAPRHYLPRREDLESAVKEEEGVDQLRMEGALKVDSFYTQCMSSYTVKTRCTHTVYAHVHVHSKQPVV